eukprot:Phypoly_transcript_09904.p1 GENE.Phypoly_transcript_09904~~Phypoly_transcript_09904.p1  ORF type:complete len:401 (+),score=84.64 Phypoly_transcript_09904:182-1204(+)
MKKVNAITDTEIYKGPDLTAQAKLPSSAEEEQTETATSKSTENSEDAAEAKVEKEETLSYSEIIGMGVSELRAELKKRGIDIPSKSLKSDMQRLLKEATKGVASTSETPKRKREESDEGKPAKKVKSESTGKSLKKTPQEKLLEHNLLQFLVQKHGTKLGNIIFYLKNLWTESPDTKVIIFSQYSRFLERIFDVFEEDGVDYAFVEGAAIKRSKAISSFKKTTSIRALLLNINNASAGTNIIEATHVIFAEPFAGRNIKEVEAQAVARAHRQGQTEQVTVVRFIIKNSIESTLFRNAYGNSLAVPRIQRTQSLTTTLATNPELQNADQMVSLLENNSALE